MCKVIVSSIDTILQNRYNTFKIKWREVMNMHQLNVILFLAASLKLSFELFPILQISLSALSGLLELFSNFLQVSTNFLDSLVRLLTILVMLLELIKRIKKEPKQTRKPRKFK
ncbi:hypothetical protein HMPREF9386_1190 [Streptococcus sanguinis SK330]|uniref:Uncharacterized protein n=3 Tax=Streptococcus sanguinis TaxID=1305 RepID=F2C7W4_STRSA|nr:hypothetical protein HMPREF9386_1190 [Streptococcus sanguinis SK330]